MALTFREEVKRHASFILRATVLVIDPASGGTSMPGWACYKAGKLLKSGALTIAGANIQERLACVHATLVEAQPDILCIERIRGNAHAHLHWAVGTTIASVCPVLLLEMPVSTWKKHAGKSHVKSDEADAKAIGECLMAIARGDFK